MALTSAGKAGLPLTQFTRSYEENQALKQKKADAQMDREFAQAFNNRKLQKLAFDLEDLQQKQEEEQRKQMVGERIDQLDRIRDAYKAYEVTRNPRHFQGLDIQDPNLAALTEAMKQGNPQAAQVFDQIYNPVYDKAARLGLREPKQTLPRKVEPAKNKKTGEIEYVDINNPSTWETHSPPEKENVKTDMKPAIDKKTGKVVLANFNDPKFNDKYRIMPDDARTTMGKDGVIVADTPDRNLSTAEEQVDREIAKQYVEWTANGGASDVAKNLSQLTGALQNLQDDTQNLTGGYIGLTPDMVLSFINPAAISNKEQVEEVVQRNLRLILGAQFTEKEGERLISRAYNDKLDEAENYQRVYRLFKQISRAAEIKQSAMEYYEKHGTIKGWEGSLMTKNDFLNMNFDEPEQEWGIANN